MHSFEKQKKYARAIESANPQLQQRKIHFFRAPEPNGEVMPGENDAGAGQTAKHGTDNQE